MLLYLREYIPSISFTKANKPIEYLKVLNFKCYYIINCFYKMLHPTPHNERMVNNFLSVLREISVWHFLVIINKVDSL